MRLFVRLSVVSLCVSVSLYVCHDFCLWFTYIGGSSYRLVQPTLPLALGRLGSLYMAAHPLALRLAPARQTHTVTAQEPSEEPSTEQYTLQPEGEGTPAEMVARACQSPHSAAALARALLRSALAAMRGSGRKRSALKLARELASMYCADGRYADASVLLTQQCGAHGCEHLAGWPLLRCDALRLLAVCCRNESGSDISRDFQKLATCLVPLLGMENVVPEGERAAIRAELVELSGAAAGSASAAVVTGKAISVELESSTLQVLLKAPISPAQQVTRSTDGSVTITLGRLALRCASPGSPSAETAAEAVALSAATGRRLSIGPTPSPVALVQTRSSGKAGEGRSTETGEAAVEGQKVVSLLPPPQHTHHHHHHYHHYHHHHPLSVCPSPLMVRPASTRRRRSRQWWSTSQHERSGLSY